MALSKRIKDATAILGVETATHKSRRATRRKRTVIAHRQRHLAARIQRRKELFQMKELRRIETRPQSNPGRLRPPSRRGHPRKHIAHRSGQRIYQP